MNEAERSAFSEHFSYLTSLQEAGHLVLAGPTGGAVNTGIVVFRADDERAARTVMEHDPVIASGIASGDLRPFTLSLGEMK